jgi:putative transposase
MDDYNHGGHTKYALKTHIIFVTKYRKPIFKDTIRSNNVKQFLYRASKRYGCTIIQMETDTDHVHMLISYRPNMCISDIV